MTVILEFLRTTSWGMCLVVSPENLGLLETISSACFSCWGDREGPPGGELEESASTGAGGQVEFCTCQMLGRW